MKNLRLKANLILLLAAAIWGTAFVAQRVGMEHMGPFTFNSIRFLLGALVLLPLILWGPKRLRSKGLPGDSLLPTLRMGLIAGLVLFAGASLQQFGMQYTTAGKAGFITGLYVVFVPVLGFFLGQKIGRMTWVGALIAAAGLYLLSIRGISGIDPGDGLVLLSALFWSTHVLVIGRFISKVSPLRLAMTQFLVCAVLSVVGALIFETIEPASIKLGAVPLLYAGILSVGVAYTLQIVAQQWAHPAHAAIILSFESVFGALGGLVILHEMMPLQGVIGCGLMLAGIILAQLGPESMKESENQEPVKDLS